jgi:transaldolase
MSTLNQKLDELIHQIAHEEVMGKKPSAETNELLEKLCSLGSELWLDTGDLDKALSTWKSELSALTTNNTLANQVVQSGVMDETIRDTVEQIRAVAPDLNGDELVTEIGFVINCKIALRLVQAFKVKVSVELHPAMSRDIEKTLTYARRYYKVCPEYFIVKVPLTPEGFMAVRQLRKEGIPINYTLGFSARQNYLAARLSNPSYVNVFLGRLNQVVSDNSLGSGDMVGEKVTLATQGALWDLRTEDPDVTTKLIGASIRNGAQVGFLAGLDVLTIPPPAMQDFMDTGDAGKVKSHVSDDITPGIDSNNPAAERFDLLWEVSDSFKEFVDLLLDQEGLDAISGDALVDFCDANKMDLFHPFSEDDLSKITEHGKIPRLGEWPDSVALDDLMTRSALQSFAKDQQALDERIISFIQ